MKSETLSLKTIIRVKRLLLNETFEKRMLLLENRLIEKIPDPCNAKEHYLSFIRTFFKPSKCKSKKTKTCF